MWTKTDRKPERRKGRKGKKEASPFSDYCPRRTTTSLDIGHVEEKKKKKKKEEKKALARNKNCWMFDTASNILNKVSKVMS